MKGVCAAFLWLQFGFVIFWHKNIGAKAACKILMKLTAVVNFTNILLAFFGLLDVTWNFFMDMMNLGNFSPSQIF